MKKIRKVRKRKQMRASFTVEAAFIIPITLFTILGGINIGYDMFKQARESSEIREELKELDPVEIVRKNTLIQGIISES